MLHRVSSLALARSTIVRIPCYLPFLAISVTLVWSMPGTRLRNSIGMYFLKFSSSSSPSEISAVSSLPIFEAFYRSGSQFLFYGKLRKLLKISAVCFGERDQRICNFGKWIVKRDIFEMILAGLISPPYEGNELLAPIMEPF